MERVKGIEPSYAAWEAAVLPLNYTRLDIPLHETPCPHNLYETRIDVTQEACFYENITHEMRRSSSFERPACSEVK